MPWALLVTPDRAVCPAYPAVKVRRENRRRDLFRVTRARKVNPDWTVSADRPVIPALPV